MHISQKKMDLNQLTPTEFDVLACLLVNAATKKIAPILGITTKTVDNHVCNIAKKLDLYGRAHIVDCVKKYADLEKSQQRYIELISAFEFEKTLQQIKKQIQFSPIFSKISCKNSELQNRLTKDLKTLDIICFERKKEISAIRVESQGNYYQIFFSVLEQLLPNKFVKDAATDFYARTSPQCAFNHEQNIQPERMVQKHKFVLFSFLLTCCIVVGQISFYLVSLYSSASKTPIRTHLSIPMAENYLNRPALIAQISAKLKRTQGIPTVVLLGMGGIGKTTVAREYARTQNVPVVFEINAENPKTILTSFENLAGILAKTAEEKTELDRIKTAENTPTYIDKLHRFIQQKLFMYKKWLLIFDNVIHFSDIQFFLPNDPKTCGQGEILVTTRNQNIKYHNTINAQHVIQMPSLSLHEQYKLLMKILRITGKNTTLADQKNKEDFLKQIPPFPLDTVVAAQYIKKTGMSFKDYLKNLSSFDSDFEASQHVFMQQTTNYGKTRYVLMSKSVQHIVEARPDFMGLLFLISTLDSQNIPKDLILACKKNQTITDDFIAQMHQYSLLNDKVDAKGEDCVSMHRSTQKNIEKYLNQTLSQTKRKQYIEESIQALELYCMPIIEASDLSKMRQMVYHLQTFLKHQQIEENLYIKKRVELLLGIVHWYLNDLKVAQQFLNSSLHYFSAHKKTTHPPFLLRATTYAGIIEKNFGNYYPAKQLLEKSIDLHMKNSREKKTNLALILCHLSYVYKSLGEFSKAKTAIEQAVEIYKTYDNNSLNFALALADLATVYHGSGHCEQAISYRQQSLALLQKVCGPHHTKTVLVNGLLGMDFQRIGRYVDALCALKKSYDDTKKNDPNNLEYISWIATKLGETYRLLGNYEQAAHFLLEGLKVARQYFGKEHIHTEWSAIPLGQFYLETGIYQDAKFILEKSLHRYIQQFGKDSYKTAVVFHQLALVYMHLGLYKQAAIYFEKSLQACKIYYGENHTDYALLLKDVGQFHIFMGDYKNAEILLNQALSILQKNKHPEIYKCFEYLGDLYIAKGKVTININECKMFKKRAHMYLQKALEIVQANFPKASVHRSRIIEKMKGLN